MKNASVKSAAALLALALLLGLSATRTIADDAPVQGFGTVTGTVMDKDGKPAAGLTVSLWTPAPKKAKDGTTLGDREMKTPKTKGSKVPPTPVSTATTGNDGSFTISNVPAGTYTIDVGEKKDPIAGYDHRQVVVKDGQNSVIALALKLPTTQKTK